MAGWVYQPLALASAVISWPFTDNFNRADSTDLGGNWFTAAGTCEIVSNQAKVTSVGGGVAVALHDLKADVRVGYTCGDGNNRGLYARVLGTDYLWAFSSGGNIGVYEFVSGAPTLLDFVAGSLAASDTFEMQAEGTNVKLYKNGSELLSTTTTVTAAGQSGIWTDTQNTIFDDYSADVPTVAGASLLAMLRSVQPMIAARVFGRIN